MSFIFESYCKKKKHELIKLQAAFEETLILGGRIFIFGCGSSGRFMLLLQKLLFERYNSGTKNIICVMAGGDIALARSIPNVEDSTEYGKKQLKHSGWDKATDLLVEVSASETAEYILSIIEYAAMGAKHRPVFVFCNPITQIKKRKGDHCFFEKRILFRVVLADLGTEPMAITGSTRMWTAPICMIATGVALWNSPSYFNNQIHELSLEIFIEKIISGLLKLPEPSLLNLITAETKIYKYKQTVLYATDRDCSISVLMDTTERNATFNLPPFINTFDDYNISKPLFGVKVEGTCSAMEAWTMILGRSPQALDWKSLPDTLKYKLDGFEFSRTNPEYSENTFHIVYDEESSNLTFSFKKEQYRLEISPSDSLLRHVMLKIILNNHSTLVMGLLGYFDGNIMTHLAPSNTKLIYRGIYFTCLLKYKKDSLSKMLKTYS